MSTGGYPEETLYRLPSYDRGRAQTVLRLMCAFLLIDLAESLLVAGAWLGRRWGNQPALGTPWIRFGAYPQIQVLAVALFASATLALLLLLPRARVAVLLAV